MTTDSETWRGFQTAREAVTTTPVDGLGFVFTAGDPLIGVDLDDCRDPETGKPTAWASQIISQLDSYTEVSPSGTGYHILVTGALPDGRNRAGDLELYDRSRFLHHRQVLYDSAPLSGRKIGQAPERFIGEYLIRDVANALGYEYRPQRKGFGRVAKSFRIHSSVDWLLIANSF